VQRALQHKDNDWSQAISSDEMSNQLFRNMIHHWFKNAQVDLRECQKNKQKIMVWGAFSIKGSISCHLLEKVMDGP